MVDGLDVSLVPSSQDFKKYKKDKKRKIAELAIEESSFVPRNGRESPDTVEAISDAADETEEQTIEEPVQVLEGVPEKKQKKKKVRMEAIEEVGESSAEISKKIKKSKKEDQQVQESIEEVGESSVDSSKKIKKSKKQAQHLEESVEEGESSVDSKKIKKSKKQLQESVEEVGESSVDPSKKIKKSKKQAQELREEAVEEVEPAIAEKKRRKPKREDMQAPIADVLSEDAIAEYRLQHHISVSGPAPPPFTTFAQANFPGYINTVWETCKFTSPTPIQAQSWPVALQKTDLVGLAQTGSGKTLAFLLPALMHIRDKMAANGGRRLNNPSALVMAPTRELACQIQSVCDQFSRAANVRSIVLYGGVPKGGQIRQLRYGVDIIIATPGRLMDMMDMEATNLGNVTYLVLDEADRMLDMGFEPQIQRVVAQIPRERQTMMFSATWPPEVQKMARDYMSHSPVQICVGHAATKLTSNHSVEQTVQVIDSRAKRRRLSEWLEKWRGQGRILVFAVYKRSCEWLCNSLRQDGWSAASMHGDKSQDQRDRALRDFKSGACPILVATDVAARGLDVKDIRFVINFEMPVNIEDYVHRVGRTGRGGATGVAVTLFTQEDSTKPGHAQGLVKILEEAKQQVPNDLKALAQRAPGKRKRVEKETDTYRAFGMRSTHVKF